MRNIYSGIVVLCFGLFLSGCIRTRDVTRYDLPKYKAIMNKTYITRSDLFLVDDRGSKCSYLFSSDPQDFPFDPSRFTGEEIHVDWGRNSFITDVVASGMLLRVEKIAHMSSPTMGMDIIYARFLTGIYEGRIVEISHLFHSSDRSEKPIVPNLQYIEEYQVPTGGVRGQPVQRQLHFPSSDSSSSGVTSRHSSL